VLSSKASEMKIKVNFQNIITEHSLYLNNTALTEKISVIDYIKALQEAKEKGDMDEAKKMMKLHLHQKRVIDVSSQYDNIFKNIITG
jgi:DNA-binding GntR family transcriptional regulator